jgi:hypothetical protein
VVGREKEEGFLELRGFVRGREKTAISSRLRLQYLLEQAWPLRFTLTAGTKGKRILFSFTTKKEQLFLHFQVTTSTGYTAYRLGILY